MSQKGKITQIIGAVVDVNFQSDLPEIDAPMANATVEYQFDL